jgi:hypothetical protein
MLTAVTDPAGLSEFRHRSPISGVDTFGGTTIATAGYDSKLIVWEADARWRVAHTTIWSINAASAMTAATS